MPTYNTESQPVTFEFQPPEPLPITQKDLMRYKGLCRYNSPGKKLDAYRREIGLKDNYIASLLEIVLTRNMEKFFKGLYVPSFRNIEAGNANLGYYSHELGSKLEIKIESPEGFIPRDGTLTVSQGTIDGFVNVMDAPASAYVAARVISAFITGDDFSFYSSTNTVIERFGSVLLRIHEPTVARIRSARQRIPELNDPNIMNIIEDAKRYWKVIQGPRDESMEAYRDFMLMARSLDPEFPHTRDAKVIQEWLAKLERGYSAFISSRIKKLKAPDLKKLIRLKHLSN